MEPHFQVFNSTSGEKGAAAQLLTVPAWNTHFLNHTFAAADSLVWLQRCPVPAEHWSGAAAEPGPGDR